jgi:diguanylate cyclase (GGDEF)-like protein
MEESRPVRIFYIEDDADARDTIADSLKQRGFEVRTARDGTTGLAELEKDPADLVLLDLTLPGDLDGLEVCRRLKRGGDSFLPIIFLTARADVRDKVRALEAGGDDFCVKPIFLDELEARMKVLLRLRERELRLKDETQRFRRIALADPLTELGNRRAFESELERAWARVERTGRPLGLLVADIDRFKAFNDRYGHRTGDEVLRAVAGSIQKSVRKGDQAFRLGGEEFVVLAPESSREGALLIAERLRASVSATKVAPPPASASTRMLSVTVSVGLATAPDPAIPSGGALLEAADRALYDAKAAGRDRVAVSAAPVQQG